MCRKSDAKAALLEEYEAYKSFHTLRTVLDVDCEESIKTLMDEIYLKAEIGYKRGILGKTTIELRRKLADYLLLLDGFDIKNTSEKVSAQPVEIIEK
jgi:hypothetical protein